MLSERKNTFEPHQETPQRDRERRENLFEIAESKEKKFPPHFEEDEAVMVLAKERAANIFFQQELKEMGVVEKEMMTKAVEELSVIDKKLEKPSKRLTARLYWLPKWFSEGSRLEKLVEELVKERVTLTNENFRSFLEKFSLEPKRFFKTVEGSGPNSEFAKRLLRNIEAISELEQKAPGSSARLAKEYGIQCFSRYPTDMLLEQLEHENNLQVPYGVALYSRDDWNGAFEEYSHEELQLLYKKTKEANLQVRIFECDGLIDTAKYLIRSNQRYGEFQKIQFAVISGHGGKNSIELGKRNLEKAAFPQQALERMRDFFIENPTLILNSCLTAKGDKGIAYLLSKVTKSRVLASKQSLYKFEVHSITKEESRYKFEVEFEVSSLFGFGKRKVKPRIFHEKTKT